MLIKHRNGDSVNLADAEIAAVEPSLEKEQEPTFPTRSTTTSSIVYEQQGETYDTSLFFSFAESVLTFMVPFPCLRLTRSTPVPSEPSLTWILISHMSELQFPEQLDW